MNRLTNEQRLQFIEFYYQNVCSVKKVHHALLPFYVQFNRPTGAAIYYAPNLHCWTLNHHTLTN